MSTCIMGRALTKLHNPRVCLPATKNELWRRLKTAYSNGVAYLHVEETMTYTLLGR